MTFDSSPSERISGAASTCIEPKTTDATRRAGPMNVPQEHVIEFVTEAGVRRRIRFVPGANGTDEWWRITEELTAELWHPVGRELVRGVVAHRRNATRGTRS